MSTPTDKPNIDIRLLERNKAMFVDYMLGLRYSELATKYEMSYDNVRRIARDHKWTNLKKQLIDREMIEARNTMSSLTVEAIGLLEEDLTRLTQVMKKESNKVLSTDDRRHLLSMIEKFFKEKKLDEGRPTDISGVVSVNINLPPGVTHYGVIPVSDPNTKVVETKSVDKKPEELIDLDSIEEALDAPAIPEPPKKADDHSGGSNETP